MSLAYRTVSALIPGAFSGLMIYVLVGISFVSWDDNSWSWVFPTWMVPVFFIGGWALSMVVLVRGARSVSDIILRSFLLGAVEWFALLLAGAIAAGRTVSVSSAELTSVAANADFLMRSVFLSYLTGRVAIVLIFLCGLGFAVTHMLSRGVVREAR